METIEPDRRWHCSFIRPRTCGPPTSSLLVAQPAHLHPLPSNQVEPTDHSTLHCTSYGAAADRCLEDFGACPDCSLIKCSRAVFGQTLRTSHANLLRVMT
jgi:hypothetical protein